MLSKSTTRRFNSPGGWMNNVADQKVRNYFELKKESKKKDKKR